MALDFSALEAELTRDSDVDNSASTLINSLADEIEASKDDPAKLQALVDKLRQNNDGLSAAVAARTPPPAEPNARKA